MEFHRIAVDLLQRKLPVFYISIPRELQFHLLVLGLECKREFQVDVNT